jgi:hypothetical protein
MKMNRLSAKAFFGFSLVLPAPPSTAAGWMIERRQYQQDGNLVRENANGNGWLAEICDVKKTAAWTTTVPFSVAHFAWPVI